MDQVAPMASQDIKPMTPVNIRSRLELLLDNHLIESVDNLSFRMHSPRPAEAVLTFDAPWEAGYCDYVTVFKDGFTPLMIAATGNSNPKVIEALLKPGANAKAKDKQGKTAADHAKENERIYKTKVYWQLNDLQYE